MSNKEILVEIEKNVKNCKKCRLWETATNPVPGEGNTSPTLAFVGEAPGKTEDETGRPFVGRAGKLLSMLLRRIDMKREDVWIGNVIKHRPPDNRDPLPDEISACKSYLTLQLEALSPKMIVTLGRFAMNYFYPEGKISRDHGRLIKINGSYIYPVYHPAAGLRNGNMYEALLKDFLEIPNILRKIDEGVYERDSEGEKEERDDGQLSLL